MNKRSRLHLPAPPARPGETPDFSYVQISPAGAVARPEISVRARDIDYLAHGLVRVLGDDAEAVGPWNPLLEASELQMGLRRMLLVRIFDERMQRTQRAGKISFYIGSLARKRCRWRSVWRYYRAICCSPLIETKGCISLVVCHSWI